MKVICERNRGEDLPERLRNEALGYKASTRFGITIGSVYVVYAMTLFLGDVWYYLCDDDYCYFPVWHPAYFFRVVDPRISVTWQYSYVQKVEKSNLTMLFAFKEWATDRYFYERLTDNDPEAVETFNKYKKIMDAEFS